MIQNMPIDECPGGITSPQGFLAGARGCRIRRLTKDVAMIVSEVPAAAAAVFTQNKTQAAPITVSKSQLKKSPYCSAVIVNSGNANACTGERGLNDAWEMVRTTATALGIPEDQVVVSSTGVIGQYLPMERILPCIAALASEVTRDGGRDAAQAIMTTDTYAKEVAVTFSLGNSVVTIGAMAKGSGMIAPNMATMLGFVTTDAAISQPLLAKALHTANAKSFNRITVDGDMSTNDMVIILANGLAKNAPIAEHTEEYTLFVAALEYVLIKLAKMIARDGEGATKLIEINVIGGTTEDEAARVAGAVANSNLVKTAIHGRDANWGRIMAAVGYSGVDFDPEQVEIFFNDLPILGKNYAILLDEEKATQVLGEENIVITIHLNQGSWGARFWTCDLSKEYVHINASYRS
ncbi:MAG: bifunctional glutamate N-acetyltransferase/amino-acid acetyltransferase ArgJ [Ignavibacteria bacterium]|nr:bifunctional glutamate N-acetyltransferase/amino-acid acetyltransferase ArgJ [Ignavibacteria bacterium]